MAAAITNRKARVIIMVVALCLLLGAVVWSVFLSNGELSRLAGIINGFGYSVRGDELFVVGSHQGVSIQGLLEGQDLSEAVAASRAAGFPSNTSAVGEIVLVLAELPEDEVITLYIRDGEIELAFVQTMNSLRVRPLGQEGSAE